ncbi:DUF4905 domain-containing protein [Mucilaginibacter litoreus]|uniref:DUF4905 domain-containing protein n=1 Tax=Mucilaginibacter litoreus TaxID=1048221 RepID=A0ABW3AM56_9SPHI
MTMFQPYISQLFEGTIWRLLIDDSKDILAIEIRNEKDKQVSFASIDLSQGEVYFTAFALPERWLAGIEAVHDGILLLHYYKHESGPEHKAIVAVDAKTGTELWSNYSIAFDHLTVNGPAVYYTAIQPKKLYILDATTGKIIRLFNDTIDKPLDVQIVIPDIYKPAEMLPGILPEEPFGNMVHYLDHNIYRIVSLHTLKNGLLQQQLYILKETIVVYHDLLNSDIQKLQPEAFVIHNNTLVYIQNKTILKALKI